MNKNLILCVEDNKKVQRLNKLAFEERGYTVTPAMTIAEAREALKQELPGLIILDINMPDGNGLNFLREFRAANPAHANIPVLVLTGYGEDKEIVAGFESGCNDYMSKPYTFPVLLMRAKELLSRAERLPDILQKGTLELDVMAGQAFLNGEDLLLGQKEFLLLLLFVQNEDRTMSAEYIYEKIWNAPIKNNNSALQKRISVIRQKLEDGNCAYTVRSVYAKGYCFEKS